MKHLDKTRPNQILDDDGEIIEIKKKEEVSAIPIGENNMRDLLQFSQSNQYFLFMNRLTFKIYLYKLDYIWDGPQLSEDNDSTEGLSF
jgi:hypothetical protein